MSWGADRKGAGAGKASEGDAPAESPHDERRRDTLPLGKGLDRWLERTLSTERGPKTRSGFHISEEHGYKAEQIRHHLTRELGFSRREASLSNVVEVSLELMHELLLGDRDRTSQSSRRSRRP